MAFYDYRVKDAQGNEIALDAYRNKVVLVVNTATGCGFTPQYEGLQKLYDQYRESGLEILDFPCNQFANQAPGTEDEIKSFCQLNYGTTFKLFAKIDVNGENEAPLYTYLKAQQPGLLGAAIKWNFTKFLVDRSGNVVKRYAPTDKPEKIESDIKNLI